MPSWRPISLSKLSPAGIPVGQFSFGEPTMSKINAVGSAGGNDLNKCPYCSKHIELEAIWCRFCQRVTRESYKKVCPVCSESILRWSRFCRFCDTSFNLSQPDGDDDPSAAVGARLKPRVPSDGVSAHYKTGIPSEPASIQGQFPISFE